MSTFRFPLLLLTLSCLTACASNVVVTGDIPKPLIVQLPLSAKLNLNEKFLNYTYTEADKDRSLNTLQFGQAQKQLFQRVFGGAFALSDDPAAITDLEVTPKVLSIQYSAPRETALNIYEVFVKYRITLTDSNQQVLEDWVIKGYGKTPTAYLKGAEAAFNAATNIALRDVGAQISVGLPLQASIRDLVKIKAATKQATSNPEEVATKHAAQNVENSQGVTSEVKP